MVSKTQMSAISKLLDKIAHFEYVILEVYIIDWPNGQWAGPTHMGYTPNSKWVRHYYYKRQIGGYICLGLYKSTSYRKISYQITAKKLLSQKLT